MQKKYIVRLTDDEREILRSIVKKLKGSSQKVRRAQMLDVYIPTQDNRTLHLQRYTEPEQEHKILLEKLKLNLPAQASPKIYSGQVLTQQIPLWWKLTPQRLSEITFYTGNRESWARINLSLFSISDKFQEAGIKHINMRLR